VFAHSSQSGRAVIPGINPSTAKQENPECDFDKIDFNLRKGMG